MKQCKLWKKAVWAIIALMIAVTLSGCGGSQLDKYSDSISELRTDLFSAENSEYKLTAIAGTREDPYELNGVSGNKRDFTVITVTPTVFESGKTIRYRAEIGGTVYEGDLLPHPFAQSLSVDIPAAAKEEFTVILTDGAEKTFEMKTAVTGELISAERAFNIALEKLKNELKRFKEKGKYNCEIYVRLTENPIDGNGGYFWYVAFVGQDKSTIAILLRGDTGAVSAIRV